jgi:ParB-like chromosome segregation protein Spo0J
MLLWIQLLGGLAAIWAIAALIAAMSRAERRARRMLFRSLGLNEEMVELLITRKGDIRAELELVRLAPPATVDPLLQLAAADTQANIRLVHPSADPRPGDTTP